MKNYSVFRLVSILFVTVLISTSTMAKGNYIFGIMPYTSNAKLLSSHLPLRYYLEEVLGASIVMTTAPDMESFTQRTQNGEYDFVLTAPHLGWLSEKRDGYQFVAATGHKIQGVFVSRKDSDIESLDELQDKSLVMATSDSLLYQLAIEELARFGHQVDLESNLQIVNSLMDAMIAPIQRKGDVALTSVSLWTKYGSNYRDDLQVIGHTQKMPGLLFMAHQKIPTLEVALIKNALEKFSETDNGNFYLSYTGFRRFKNIDIDVRKSMEKYISFAQN